MQRRRGKVCVKGRNTGQLGSYARAAAACSIWYFDVALQILHCQQEADVCCLSSGQGHAHQDGGHNRRPVAQIIFQVTVVPCPLRNVSQDRQLTCST